MTLDAQDYNGDISFLTTRSIKSRLKRNDGKSSGSEHAAELFNTELCSSEPPPQLHLHRLLSCDRVKAVAQHFLKQSVNCSGVSLLSLKNVKVSRDVALLVCQALQCAALKQLDFTN